MGPGVEGIILAAGCSSRAGSFKMEVPLAGKPLLLWCLETMAAVCERVIVVAGFAPEKIRCLLRGRPEAELVVNEDFASGMLTSVQAGVRSIGAPRFFIMPGDMPLVKTAVFHRLLAARAGIAVPLYRGRRGHPVLLDGHLAEPLLAEAPDSSLGRFIRRHGFTAVEVDDPGILVDVDASDDLKKADALLRGGGKDE